MAEVAAFCQLSIGSVIISENVNTMGLLATLFPPFLPRAECPAGLGRSECVPNSVCFSNADGVLFSVALDRNTV